MPAERAPMRKIREVLRLKHACGLSERRIALAIGLSRSTIKAYLKRADSCGIAWPLAPEIEDSALERQLFPLVEVARDVARPLPEWREVQRELKRRGVTLQLLWEEYRAHHHDGYVLIDYPVEKPLGQDQMCTRHLRCLPLLGVNDLQNVVFADLANRPVDPASDEDGAQNALHLSGLPFRTQLVGNEGIRDVCERMFSA